MATALSALRVNPVEEQTAEREAVVRILLDIQRDEGVTLLDIAETIGVSLGTISNAANKKTDLCRTYLKRLGKAFGGHYLDPFHALYGIRSVPIDAGNVRDILPFLARATSKIAEARDPQGDGGGRETHREKLGYLPELERLQAELSKLICDIQSLRVRAA
jgi:transcriptional regulator with XRE-family HTH domain